MPTQENDTAQPAQEPTGETPLTIVGIGASAGGLEALSALVAHLPTDLGFCYVIIQHLSPSYRSMLVQLLGRETLMPVREITACEPPQPNTIYIAPASSNVIIRAGMLYQIGLDKEILPRPSVNLFFASLAREQAEFSIGIILSGTGSDGASGIREIKAAGGLTLAQAPASARYPGMPQAAIDTDCVDWIATPDQLARELTAIARQEIRPRTREQQHDGNTLLQKLLQQMRQRTRIDFSGYKEGTLWRRIERRMSATHTRFFEDYLHLVERDPEELERLGKDILISVTAFFRDPEAFAELRQALIHLLANKQPGDEIRIWVPGCATGEEPYSLAILLAEILGVRVGQFKIQIFATDIDLSAMAAARRAQYPSSALADPLLAGIRKYFNIKGDAYEIIKPIRDMVLFARQDLVLDPPFLRLDLISCRNVLIYFRNALQSRILAIFHYALRPGACLFLGKSEGIFQQENLFDTLDKASRLFRRKENPATPASLPPLNEYHDAMVRERQRLDQQNRKLNQLYLETAARHYLPPGVLINSRFEILHVQGHLDDYLLIPAGKPTFDLPHLIHRDFRADLQRLQRQAEIHHSSQTGSPRLLLLADARRHVRLSVHPVVQAETAPCYLVCFETVPAREAHDMLPGQPSGGQPLPVAPGGEPDIKALEDELITTREHLQTVIEELETANEEMQSLNEEVQAANEELQSANEELQSTNEELQSTNEELITVNDELQSKALALAETNNDLEHIQNSIACPVLVVSRDLRVLRHNQPAALFFGLPHLQPAHEQGLPRLSLPFGLESLAEMIRQVENSGTACEQVLDVGPHHYIVSVRPYAPLNAQQERGSIVVVMDQSERLEAERLLRERENHIRTIMNHSSSMFALKDTVGRYLFVNAQFARFFGLEAEAMLGRTDFQLFPEKLASEIRAREVDVLHGQQAVESEETVALQGAQYTLQTVRTPLQANDGVVTALCVQSSDISVRKRAEEQLRLAARVFERTGEGIIISDADGRILTVNEAFTHVTGYTLDEVRGHRPNLLKSGKHDADFYQAMWEYLKRHGHWQGEIWNRRKGGEIYPEWLSINVVLDGAGNITNYVGIFSDISVVKESKQRIEFLATHDALTNLPNRTLFMDRLGLAMAKAERATQQLAVLFIDLDNFKLVNDSLGHDMGDRLLQQVARQLQDSVRSVDTVARLGGDEFAILLENTSQRETEILLHRLNEALSHPHRIGEQVLFASASVGASFFPNDGSDIQTLLKNADTAMYRAKEMGKNTHYFFSEEMKHLARERLELENGLRQALEHNELFLVYQPQISLAGRQLQGFEALLRWRHPQRGIVMPDVFIPVAEHSRLIERLGDWVLEAVCRQMQCWQQSGYVMPRISINFSPRQFHRQDVVAHIGETLARFSVNPQCLGIEFTENVLIEDSDSIRDTLDALRALGVHLSIDDFGTGYSSLSYLRQHRVNELKIDRSFICDLAENQDDQALVTSIIHIARTLGMQVVAEGVEHESQVNVLSGHGCHSIQGYYFARPLPVAEAETFLHRQQAA